MFGLASTLFQPYESRQVAPKICPEANNGIGVSTVFASDVKQYETALLDANGAHPVERYDTERKAKRGHKKWQQLAHDPNLKAVMELRTYGDKDRTIKLRRVKCPKSSK